MLVCVAVVKDLLEGDAALLYGVLDVFEDSVTQHKWFFFYSLTSLTSSSPVHDEGYGAHEGGLEDRGVTAVALADLRRHVRHSIGRGVTNLNCWRCGKIFFEKKKDSTIWKWFNLNPEEHHCVLAEQFEDVGEGQKGDVDVVLGAQHEHQTLHSCNQIAVREKLVRL